MLSKKSAGPIKTAFSTSNIFGDPIYNEPDEMAIKKMKQFFLPCDVDDLVYSDFENSESDFPPKKTTSKKIFRAGKKSLRHFKGRITRREMEEQWRKGNKNYLLCAGCRRFVRRTSKRYHVHICAGSNNGTLAFLNPEGQISQIYTFKESNRKR
ncbi:hypothetical protein MHBO_003847, partial [Bonamia ostreae]